jgi:hypothetical protein
VTFGNGVVQGFTYDNAALLATQTNDLASTTNDLTQTFAYNPASHTISGDTILISSSLHHFRGHHFRGHPFPGTPFPGTQY